MNETQQLYSFAREVLKKDPENYECYQLLGEYHQKEQPELSYLYYEQAAFYCPDETKREEIFRLQTMAEKQLHSEPHGVSVIIPVYNAFEQLELCVQSLRRTLPSEAYELIVIDNASTDERVVPYLDSLPEITVIKNDANLGFAKACNQGAERATPGNALFFLNSDAILLPGSLLYLRIALLRGGVPVQYPV